MRASQAFVPFLIAVTVAGLVVVKNGCFKSPSHHDSPPFAPVSVRGSETPKPFVFQNGTPPPVGDFLTPHERRLRGEEPRQGEEAAPPLPELILRK